MKPKLFIVPALFYLTLFACLKEPCELQNCLNGGVCMDGLCDCPDQYTGEDCSQQRTPHFIRINNITVTRFPGQNQDMSWDPLDGPDLFFRLYAGEEPIAQPMLLVENADAQQDYFFFINIIDMRMPDIMHTLKLFDYDGPGANHPLLGEVSFLPYHEHNQFPSTIVIDNGGSIAFTITVSYHFISEKD